MTDTIDLWRDPETMAHLTALLPESLHPTLYEMAEQMYLHLVEDAEAVAILGLPPFGVFASEFLLLTTAIKHYPWAAPILLIALGVAFAAMLGKVQDMVLGEPNVQPLAHNPALLPVFTHLGLVLMLGLWMPPALADWYRLAARLIG